VGSYKKMPPQIVDSRAPGGRWVILFVRVGKGVGLASPHIRVFGTAERSYGVLAEFTHTQGPGS